MDNAAGTESTEGLMDSFHPHERYSRLLENNLWVDDITDRLKGGDMTPLNLAVMMQENVSIIRQLYEAHPGSGGTYQETIGLACTYGAQPGVIPFLTEKMPQYASCPSEFWSLEAFPISIAMDKGPGEDRPSEEDIKCLVDAWPEGVVTSMGWYNYDESMYYESTPLQQCLAKGYSNDLFEYMLSNLPDSIDEVFINDLGVHDIGWISIIFPKIEEDITISGETWHEAIIYQVFHLLFQNPHLKRLNLTFPDSIEGSEGAVDTANMESLLKSMSSHPSQWAHPSIEALALSLPTNPTYLPLLDCLPYWPCLSNLAVDCSYVEPPISVLCNLLERGKLEQLSIALPDSLTATRKRKSHTGERETTPLQPLFDALANNTTLKAFCLNGILWPRFRTYENLMLEVLKKGNVTLEEVNCCSNQPSTDPITSTLITSRELEYYLMLNKCGRAVARATTTRLGDFVALLGSIEEEIGRDNIQLMSSVKYGLLREAVAVWAGSHASSEHSWSLR